MPAPADPQHVVTAGRRIAADAELLFQLIADPAEQPRWDGNDNLAAAAPGQRVRAVGDVFVTRLSNGQDRENHVCEFVEGRLVAWRPSDPGKAPAGHLWRWELERVDASQTLVRHTYDWSGLTDEARVPRARATTPGSLSSSLDRLAELAERVDGTTSSGS